MAIQGYGRAIFTKYLGPTDFKGSRIKAYDQERHSVTIGYDHAGTDTDRHDEAALALLEKMGWPTGNLARGGTKEGFVYVFLPEGE
jgi:hypothetical protein